MLLSSWGLHLRKLPQQSRQGQVSLLMRRKLLLPTRKMRLQGLPLGPEGEEVGLRMLRQGR